MGAIRNSIQGAHIAAQNIAHPQLAEMIVNKSEDKQPAPEGIAQTAIHSTSKAFHFLPAADKVQMK
jgi:hypothetical protein